MSDDAQAVVVEVPEAVSTALDEFHFALESFCDAIVAEKSPHGGDGFEPGLEGPGQGDEWFKTAFGKLANEYFPVDAFQERMKRYCKRSIFPTSHSGGPKRPGCLGGALNPERSGGPIP